MTKAPHKAVRIISTISTRVQRRRVESCIPPACQFRELLQFRFTLVGVTEFLVKHFYPTVQPIPLGFMNTKQKPVVAVVEDDRSLASLIDEQLSEAGFATHVFHKGGSALKHLEANHAHLVLLDLALPDMDGMELFARMQRLRAPVPVVILSATDSDIVVARALDAGADDYIRKPFNGTELCARLRAVLRRTETARDLRLTRNADLATGVFDFGTAQVHPERLELEFKDGRRCKTGHPLPSPRQPWGHCQPSCPHPLRLGSARRHTQPVARSIRCQNSRAFRQTQRILKLLPHDSRHRLLVRAGAIILSYAQTLRARRPRCCVEYPSVPGRSGC